MGGYGAIIVSAEVVMWPANPGTMGFTPGRSTNSTGAASPARLTGGSCCAGASVGSSHWCYFGLFAVFWKVRVLTCLRVYSVYQQRLGILRGFSSFCCDCTFKVSLVHEKLQRDARSNPSSSPEVALKDGGRKTCCLKVTPTLGAQK